MSLEPLSIRCRGVSRSYRSSVGSTEALDDFDATFTAGRLSAVVGPSGSGKSTLLRLLGGIDAPDRGTIEVGRVDVAQLSGGALRAYRRSTTAFLAQRAASNLVPHLTIQEQLGPGGAELAERLGVAHRIDARAASLSGGEQARAALAVGLSRATSVVLADEPTAELDRDAAAHVIEALRAATAEGRTVVVATHDPDVMSVADETVDLGTHASVDALHGERRAHAGPPVISAQALTKSYAGARVVDAASIDVHAGELSVLLGRSGSGKSTLLMALGGWLAADSGAARTPGTAWHETAYLAQRFALLGELSVYENVALPLRLAGHDPEVVRAMLDRLGLAELEARLPAETSVGQQQRTALARALVARPRALLADEPTSHQDAASAERVWNALAAACADGTACLVATHDEDAALRADRAWRIEEGRIA